MPVFTGIFALMAAYTYILQSRKNDSLYKGSCDDLVIRIKRHNAGLDTYTKKFIPWDLVWYTRKNNRAEARALERKLKNLSILRTIEFINKYPPAHCDDRLVIFPLRNNDS